MQLNLNMVCGADGKSRQENYIFEPDSEGIENQVINLYPQIKYQTLEGFGGAITDAAGSVYAQMSEENKKKLLQTYFGPEQMNYQLVRTHMDSCDFATGMYEAMSGPKDPDDFDFTEFTFARTEKYILPMLLDAQKISPQPLKLMLSPWSPPAFMKTNGKRVGGGSLKKEYYPMWAEYLCRYIQEFEKRGFQVERMSIQNEAKAVQTWDSCVYRPEEEKEFLENYLVPALEKGGLSHVEVFIWDHNKERVFDRACQIIGEAAVEEIGGHETAGKGTEDKGGHRTAGKGAVGKETAGKGVAGKETAGKGAAGKRIPAGVAFHWYSGDHFEALDMVGRKYPDLKLILSESCIEYSKTQAGDSLRQASALAHEIIGDLNHGMEAFYDWNILLDETGGPNHVGNLCHAPFLYDREKQELKEQLILKYFYHFTHYIHPGAVRIGSSRYTDQLEVTAFENPDGTIAIVLLNRGKEPRPAVIRMKEQIIKMEIPGESIAAGIITDIR